MAVDSVAESLYAVRGGVVSGIPGSYSINWFMFRPDGELGRLGRFGVPAARAGVFGRRLQDPAARPAGKS